MRNVIALVLLAAQSPAVPALLSFMNPPPKQPALHFRPGLPTDNPLIRQSMLEARMNPAFLKPEYFTIAEHPGPNAGTGRATTAGFGQIRPILGTGGQVCELASVYVLPASRNQRIGSRIIARLVENFRADKSRARQVPSSSQSVPTPRLVLLTLADTAPFYSPHGFLVLPDPVRAKPHLPMLFVLEYLAGSVVARLSRGPATKLVCMELQEGGNSGRRAAKRTN